MSAIVGRKFDREPTLDELDRFTMEAVDRLHRKYPSMRGRIKEARGKDAFADKLIDSMVVWMAETPNWETIP